MVPIPNSDLQQKTLNMYLHEQESISKNAITNT